MRRLLVRGRKSRAGLVRNLQTVLVPPPILSEFAAELESQGFTTTDQRHEARASGNGLLELTKSPTQRLRFVCDRGQWFIEITVNTTWANPYLVVLALQGDKYVRRALSHTEHVRYARQALERIPTDAVEQTTLTRQVRAFRQEDWEDRYGPTDWPEVE